MEAKNVDSSERMEAVKKMKSAGVMEEGEKVAGNE